MKRIAMGVASLALAAGATVATTAPAQAAPLFTGGLVNVNVSDLDVLNDSYVLNDVLSQNNVSVGAALNIAAEICGVGVNVLAQQLRTDEVTCSTETGDQVVDIVATQ